MVPQQRAPDPAQVSVGRRTDSKPRDVLKADGHPGAEGCATLPSARDAQAVQKAAHVKTVRFYSHSLNTCHTQGHVNL